MLLNTYSVLNSSPGRAIGGFTNLYSNYKPSSWYSFYDNDTEVTTTLKRASFPSGTEPHYSWILAPKGGELSSTTTLGGGSSILAAMAMGRAISVDLAGSSSILAGLSLISSMSADLAGTSTLSGSIASTLSLAATLIGSGDVSAGLSLLVGIQSTLTGTGTLTVDLKGKASLAASIFVNSGSATIQELVDGVWSALASDYNSSGTMGQKLNAAGTAGDPWTTDLSAYNTTDTAGLIMKTINSNVKKTKAIASASL